MKTWKLVCLVIGCILIVLSPFVALGVILYNRSPSAVGLLVVGITLLMAAVAPVLATPAQKIAFTVKSAPVSVTPVDTDTTPSGIIHTEVSFIGKLFGATGTEASIFSGAPTVSGINIQNVNSNTAQGEVKVHWTWHLTGGSFEGNFAGDVDGVGLTAALVNLHGVLQGTGDYSGWTISVDGNKPSGQPFAWTGTILIP